jgi:hypothetical protein
MISYFGVKIFLHPIERNKAIRSLCFFCYNALKLSFASVESNDERKITNKVTLDFRKLLQYNI